MSFIFNLFNFVVKAAISIYTMSANILTFLQSVHIYEPSIFSGLHKYVIAGEGEKEKHEEY